MSQGVLSFQNFEDPSRRAARRDRLRGIHYALVVSNKGAKDPHYQVEVSFPWLPGEDKSYWARIAVPMAGPEQGTYFLPQPGDQVLVLFEHGVISRPIVIGSIYSEKQPAPERNHNGKNDLRVIKSKSGHRVILDDTSGAERIVIVDSSQSQKIVIDSARNTVTVESGEGNINIVAEKAVRMHGAEVTLTAAQRWAATATSTAELHTTAAINAVAKGTLALNGDQVQLNPPGLSASTKVPASKIPEANTQRAEKPNVQVEDPGERDSNVGGFLKELAHQALEDLVTTAAREHVPPEFRRGVATVRKIDGLSKMLPEIRDSPGKILTAAGTVAEIVNAGDVVKFVAIVDNVTDVIYEIIDEDTDAIIDSGVAIIEDGIASATWGTDELGDGISGIFARFVGDGVETETAVVPVEGRGRTSASSPSNDLVDPTKPMPAGGAAGDGSGAGEVGAAGDEVGGVGAAGDGSGADEVGVVGAAGDGSGVGESEADEPVAGASVSSQSVAAGAVAAGAAVGATGESVAGESVAGESVASESVVSEPVVPGAGADRPGGVPGGPEGHLDDEGDPSGGGDDIIDKAKDLADDAKDGSDL